MESPPSSKISVNSFNSQETYDCEGDALFTNIEVTDEEFDIEEAYSDHFEPTVPEPTVPEPTVPEPTVPESTVPERTVPDFSVESAEQSNSIIFRMASDSYLENLYNISPNLLNTQRISQLSYQVDEDSQNDDLMDLTSHGSCKSSHIELVVPVDQGGPERRSTLLLTCIKLREKNREQKIKNAYLQRKMSEYFKRKKMEYVLHETAPNLEYLLNQYNDKLMKYEEKKQEVVYLELDIEEEFTKQTKIKNEKLAILNKEFEDLQNLEYEHGSVLRTAQRGNFLPREFVLKLLRRQKEKMEILAKDRVKYITARDKVIDIELDIKSLEYIDEGLKISSYEALYADKSSLTDKLEEFEDQLERQRVKCNTCVQMLAHVREKSSAATMDISSHLESLQNLLSNLKIIRRRLAEKSSLKCSIYKKIMKLKNEKILLLNKDLFNDYCNTNNKIASKIEELNHLKEYTTNLEAKKNKILRKKYTVKKI